MYPSEEKDKGKINRVFTSAIFRKCSSRNLRLYFVNVCKRDPLRLKILGNFEIDLIRSLHHIFAQTGSPPTASTYQRLFLAEVETKVLLISKSQEVAQRCSIRKVFLKDFVKLIGKHICQCLFLNKVAGL